MAEEYERLAAELNTLLAQPPTANSVADMLHADGSYTYDNTTDSLEAIANAIAGMATLSDKEKSLLGLGVHPGFQDFFNDVAEGGDPTTDNWTVIENSGAVAVKHLTSYLPGSLDFIDGSSTGNDAIAHTLGKRMFTLKEGVTTIFLKARVRFNFQAGATGVQIGIGFMEGDAAPASMADIIAAAKEVASIVINNSAAACYASDGSTAESDDLSSFISDNTWVTIEIRITASAVTFYTADTLRATLNTNVPSANWFVAAGCTNVVGSGNEILDIQWIQVWAE
jgi:hypothetical protein